MVVRMCRGPADAIMRQCDEKMPEEFILHRLLETLKGVEMRLDATKVPIYSLA
jgi:hypothetical protein